MRILMVLALVGTVSCGRDELTHPPKDGGSDAKPDAVDAVVDAVVDAAIDPVVDAPMFLPDGYPCSKDSECLGQHCEDAMGHQGAGTCTSKIPCATCQIRNPTTKKCDDTCTNTGECCCPSKNKCQVRDTPGCCV